MRADDILSLTAEKARALSKEGGEERLNKIEDEIQELEIQNDLLDPRLEADLERLEINVSRLRELQGCVLRELWKVEKDSSQLIKAV